MCKSQNVCPSVVINHIFNKSLSIQASPLTLTNCRLPFLLLLLEIRDSQNCHKAIPVNPSSKFPSKFKLNSHPNSHQIFRQNSHQSLNENSHQNSLSRTTKSKKKVKRKSKKEKKEKKEKNEKQI